MLKGDALEHLHHLSVLLRQHEAEQILQDLDFNPCPASSELGELGQFFASLSVSLRTCKWV